MTLARLDQLFVQVNYDPEDNEFNPGNELVRYEFMELLVRCAKVKYKDTGMVKTFSQALDMLLSENIIPNSNHYEW